MLAETKSSSHTHAALANASLAHVRSTIRSGQYTRHTAGLAQGRLQCNLVILPAAYADAFDAFCARNAQACPVVGKSEPGSYRIPPLGADLDLRTDVPRYIVYRDGVPTDTVHDLHALWRDDFVTFALGCSFTFERALVADGIPMRHIAADKTVPMFISNRETVPAGPFGGKMVVSMRPIPQGEVERARAISARYPLAHGAPVHVGDPAIIEMQWPSSREKRRSSGPAGSPRKLLCARPGPRSALPTPPAPCSSPTSMSSMPPQPKPTSDDPSNQESRQ